MYFVMLFFWVVAPIVFGQFLFVFSPYLIKKFWVKPPQRIPSMVPFWLIVIILVQLMNQIWIHKLDGFIFHEWDRGFVEYSLLSYQSPLLDGTGSWLAPEWRLWQLYCLWLISSILIYGVSFFLSHFLYRKDVNIVLYRKVILISVGVMLLIGCFSALMYSHLL